MNRIIFMIILAFFPKFVFAEHVTPEQLLERYKANRNALRRHITKGEDLREHRDTAYGDEYKLWMLSEFEFRTDGERVDLITNEHFNLQNPEDKASAEQSSEKRKIWDGEIFSSCSYEIAPRRSRASMSKREEKKRDLLAVGYVGSSLDSIFEGDRQPVDLILSQASDIAVRPEMEKVNGTNCYVIDAITPNGKYNLWIDPEHGYNIAKAKVHKTGSDILYGKPISQHEAPRVRKGVGYDGILPGKRSEHFFWLDIIEFQKIGSVWVPIEAVGQVEIRCDDGRIMSGKQHHKRTHIDPNPDFEVIGAFVPDFPEGTSVYLEYAPSIPFIWKGGKPVPYVDQEFLDIVDKEIEQVKNEIIAELAVPTLKKTDTPNDEPAAAGYARADAVESQPKVLSESRFSPVLVLIPIGLLIIGVIGWLVFHRLKT